MNENTAHTDLAAAIGVVERDRRLSLSDEQRARVDRFLFSGMHFSQHEYWSSYPQWARGGRGWWPLHQGGTGIMLALMWYHHRHKPGSREWRPAVIIKALLEETKHGE
jgi:hypothetical protein